MCINVMHKYLNPLGHYLFTQYCIRIETLKASNGDFKTKI